MSLNATQGAPTDESSADLFADSLNLVATTTIEGTAYGIMFTLYIICVHFLRRKLGNRKDKDSRTWFFLVYTSCMFILGTLYTVSSARTIQLAYVNHRLFDAGPAAYDILIFSEPINILGIVSYVIANWFADALIVSLSDHNNTSTNIVGFLPLPSSGDFSLFIEACHVGNG